MSDPMALAAEALEGAAHLLDQEQALKLLAVYARRLAPPTDTPAPQATITRGQAAGLDDCAEIFVPVPQWTTAEGGPRGLWLRAPTFRDCMLAERRATIRNEKTGEGRTDEWRQIAEELAACIARPTNISVDTILTWNAEVVYALHRRLRQLAALPGALVAAELARLAGGPPPPPPAPLGAPDRPAAPAAAADDA